MINEESVRTKLQDYQHNWYMAHRDERKKASLASNARQRKKRRQLYLEAKQEPCTDCSRRYPAAVMEFDHVPGTDKVFNVSAYVRRSTTRLVDEMSKCDIVCANCHRIRTVWRRRYPTIRRLIQA